MAGFVRYRNNHQNHLLDAIKAHQLIGLSAFSHQPLQNTGIRVRVYIVQFYIKKWDKSTSAVNAYVDGHKVIVQSCTLQSRPIFCARRVDLTVAYGKHAFTSRGRKGCGPARLDPTIPTYSVILNAVVSNDRETVGQITDQTKG